jgi:transcriptional regulator with XRE-family HTH domain
MSTKSRDATEFFNELRKGKPLGLCELLLSLRLAEEMTQQEFAKKLGISKQNLCDIEKKRKGVSPGRAAKFAKKLGHSDVVFVQLAMQDILTSDKLKMKVTIKAA